MNMYFILILCALSAALSLEMKFPDDFKFGVATSSYQVEGAWNEDGKGENMWDRLTHYQPDWIMDKSNGDVACDTYHKYKEDVALLKDLGVHFYRFSLSWSRLLPSGFTNNINEKGVIYYKNLIDELLQNGIEPYVTLYHWDLPQSLHEIGGWPNPFLADAFEDYARFVFKTFGDRVKIWVTFNEPPKICQGGYGQGESAPNYVSDGIGTYMCGRTILLSHARAYRVYDQEFRKEQKGKIGIAINANWFVPVNDSPENIEMAEISMQMDIGWWAHPILSKKGDYPPIMKERIAERSIKENFPRTRLQPFSAEEVALIRGTCDFFGLNHYGSRVVDVTRVPTGPIPSYHRDVGVVPYLDESWPASAAPWLREFPAGFRKLLNFVRTEYGNPEVYILENGFTDKGELQDDERIHYLKGYMGAVLDSILLDDCNIKVYTIWSFLDNFEWREGYTLKFGLYHVDFTSPNRTRTPKSSVEFYKNVIITKVIPH